MDFNTVIGQKKYLNNDCRKTNLTAVHVTISYHEQFRETVSNFEQWNRWFEQFPNLIIRGYQFRCRNCKKRK